MKDTEEGLRDTGNKPRRKFSVTGIPGDEIISQNQQIQTVQKCPKNKPKV